MGVCVCVCVCVSVCVCVCVYVGVSQSQVINGRYSADGSSQTAYALAVILVL